MAALVAYSDLMKWKGTLMQPIRILKESMDTIIRAGVILAIVTTAAEAQPVISKAQADAMHPLSPADIPAVGTFWSMQDLPPMPSDPFGPRGLQVPVYKLANGQFLLDDADVDYSSLGGVGVLASARSMSATTMATISLPDPGDGGDDGDTNSVPIGPDPADLVRNFAKFAHQTCTLIDTNSAAYADTNLYNAVISFPPDSQQYAHLQILAYTANAVIIKANHFDYSSETRNFALLIVDKVSRPTWKNVDLSGSTDSEDGWLVQGTVPPYKVTDPMFLMVSNINTEWNGFFRAVPYAGPQVQITGAQDYDTVSGVKALQAVVTDLGGTTSTNQMFKVAVNGLPARYTLGAGNTISLDTHYAVNGIQDVEFTLSSVPLAFDSANPPLDTQWEWDTTADIALDFENAAFLVNASDMSSPEAGTNYIEFGVNQADTISATISDPSTGRVLAQYAGSVPSASAVLLGWNYTDSTGSRYTNATYAVRFTANDPTTLQITNTINTAGVRSAAGVVITYAQEPVRPNDPTDPGPTLNSQADQWIGSTLPFLYNDIYDQWGFTQYGIWDIGLGRNIVALSEDIVTTNSGWRQTMQQQLGSLLYSDATIGPAHGSAIAFGANGGVGTTASSRDIMNWVTGAGNNWKMRKVAMWTCQSGANGAVTNISVYPPFPVAFGILPGPVQINGLMKKNAGLFFAYALDQSLPCAQMEETFDELWVCGENAWPGGCDPTYSFKRILGDTLAQYPNLQKAGPVLAGYPILPYTGLHDSELMTNNPASITQ